MIGSRPGIAHLISSGGRRPSGPIWLL